jgi:FAD/FMN-containing dehydrogenase
MNDTAVAAFRRTFDGEVVMPGDSGYDAARVVWNGMIDRRPAVVARCANVHDVIAAIRLARELDLVVAIRGGGHSVGGFSTCDGGVVIDLSGMRGAQADPGARVARVNGGALLGELDRAAQAFGLACPVGVVGHTGVAGLTLGGGMGRLQRRYGLTIDNLLSADVVDAEGELIHVSEDENGDLFWGIRGAGANFGVVTSFELRLHPVGPSVTQGIAAYPVDRAEDLAPTYRELLAEAPDEPMLTMGFVFGSADPPFGPEMAGRPIITLGATHSGSPEEAERDLRPLRNRGPLVDTFAPKPYLAIQGMNRRGARLGQALLHERGLSGRPHRRGDRGLYRAAHSRAGHAL